MLLESIKLSGFKSFADKTLIEIRSHLNAIVGPNGCGKSNVVDAIRWVIGESSAKQLRSQSMADVIFNGTTKRSAAGRARVELCFNNHLGRIAGPFADFDTIQIAREVTADGQSTYSINQRNCRRKDILDLFSGTGMGSRSYSIIEQGMISRLIEAKPEELRIFLEEACGISKYKDRRRETNTRMRHCEENLARVTDICEELATQFRKLSRQARNAERYQELSAEEHTLKNQVLALKYDALKEERSNLENKLEQSEQDYQEHQANLENVENNYEELLETQKVANENQYDIQRELYEVQNRIQSIEQTIKHQNQQKVWREEQIERSQNAYQEYQQMIEEQIQQIDQIQQELSELIPQINVSELTLSESEDAVQLAQQLVEEKNQAWANFIETQNTLTSKINLFEQKIKHLSYLLEQSRNRQIQLETELNELDVLALEQQYAEAEQKFTEFQGVQQELVETIEQNEATWQVLNQQQKAIQDELAELRTQNQQASGRLSSLQALQEAALKDDNNQVSQWLSEHQLNNLSRLGQEIKVDEQWEKALEIVLNDLMTGLCLNAKDPSDFINETAPKGTLTLLTQNSDHQQSAKVLNHPTLADKVETAYALPLDLNTIYLAQTEDEVKSLLLQIPSHASVLLPDGRQFAKDWCQFIHKSEAQTGMLQRGRDIEELQQHIESLTIQVETKTAEKNAILEQLQQCEEEKAPLKARQHEIGRLVNQSLSEKTQAEAQLNSKRQRKQTIDEQLQHIMTEVENHAQELAECQDAESSAKTSLAQLEQTHANLALEKTEAQSSVQSFNQQQANAKSTHQELMMKKLRQEDQLASLQQLLAKNQLELERISSNRAELMQSEDESEDHSHLNEELESQQVLFEQQTNIVNQAKQELQQLESTIKEIQSQKHALSNQVHQDQERVSKLKVNLQSCLVKQNGVVESFEEQVREKLVEEATKVAQAELAEKQKEAEQLALLESMNAEETIAKDAAAETAQTTDIQDQAEQLVINESNEVATQANPEPELVIEVSEDEVVEQAQTMLDHWLQHLPDNQNIDECAQLLADITRKISRLGAINLAAIEECKEIEIRKDELETQKSDLEEALVTLKKAIADIDEACKTTLQETYDKVNTRFQEIFPGVFGGGKACLELMEDDILTTGILVRAQPPGKRVAAIHMLSGGEKALTAISLVFALFNLNPAPFCILDEVDAPLDDLNVERYCKLIEQMAKETQFMVISHNKTTIAHMDHLIGVTMGEPGVSRIVSVDMEEAVNMLD